MTTAAATLHDAAPVASPERIHALDILRGAALFGMIVVHFHQRVNTEATGFEGLIGWIVWIGVETKAWGTFAFLFGVGFAVLLRRMEAKGLPFFGFYLRRLFVLALFGIVAEAFFGFHVLLGYALWGVPLLFLRRLSTTALLAVALLAVVAGPLLSLGAGLGLLPPLTSAASAETGQLLAAAVETAGRSGSWGQLLAARLDWMAWKYLRLATLVPDVTLTLFVLGLLALRTGVVDEPLRHARAVLGWMTFGFLSWACTWLVLYRVELPPRVAGLTYALVRDQWLCLTFMGAVVLALAYRPVWQRRLMGFGWAGRMALTNYMLQVAALDFIVSGYGLSLRLRPAWGMMGAALLFLAEVAFSRWWLARNRFGPLEWLWRSLTYGRRQPLRLPGETPVLEPAVPG